MKKNRSKRQKITFNYIEIFKTNIPNQTEEDLKEIFNKKFYEYIKKKELRIFPNLSDVKAIK